jgi:hypothetical protein
LGSNGPSNRDRALEAMRTQVGVNQCLDCKECLFAIAQASIILDVETLSLGNWRFGPSHIFHSPALPAG